MNSESFSSVGLRVVGIDKIYLQSRHTLSSQMTQLRHGKDADGNELMPSTSAIDAGPNGAVDNVFVADANIG